IEVKHWTQQWVDANRDLVHHEADRVTNKARKIGTTLRRAFLQLPRVDGVILLTQDASKVKRLTGQQARGVRFHSLSDWKAAVDFGGPQVLSAHDIARLGKMLEPKS